MARNRWGSTTELEVVKMRASHLTIMIFWKIFIDMCWRHTQTDEDVWKKEKKGQSPENTIKVPETETKRIRRERAGKKASTITTVNDWTGNWSFYLAWNSLKHTQFISLNILFDCFYDLNSFKAESVCSISLRDELSLLISLSQSMSDVIIITTSVLQSQTWCAPNVQCVVCTVCTLYTVQS